MYKIWNIFGVAFAVLWFSFLPESAAETGKILSINPENVPRYVETVQGVKLVFIYASWCPYCRQAMPDVVDLSAVRPKAVIALSVDDDPGRLLQYISEDYGGKFPLGTSPIVVKEEYSGQLRSILGRAWKTEIGEGIPRMILLDADNNVIVQGVNITHEAATVILKQ